MADTRKAEKIEPGSSAFFALMGAEYGYNFLTGDEYRQMQEYSKKIWDAALAARDAKWQGEVPRKPLTTDQIYAMYSEPSSDAEMVAFAREVEKAHGIVHDNDHEFWIGVCESLDSAKGGVQAQVDAAFESRRQRFVKLPKYSFLLVDGGVRRVEDSCGNWVEFSAAHFLFEPPEITANDHIKQLEAERDAALVDAKRYRWIAEHAVVETRMWIHDGADPASTQHVLDNVIDAAMKGEQ